MTPQRLFAVVVAVVAAGAAAGAKISSGIVNTNLERSVDATSFVLRESARISFKSTSGSVSKYHVAIPAERVRSLAAFSAATPKGKALEMEKEGLQDDGSLLLVVRMRKGVDEGKTFTVVVKTAFVNLFEPFPAKVKQNEPQLVRWTDSHFFFSPYATESQKLTVRLESTRVESFTRKKPSAHRGDRLTFGPYKKEVAPFTASPLEIHAENNSPFVALTSVEREVEVSHWGNVAVEEVYDMRHGGAELEGGFSRYDYQMQRHSRGPHFREVSAVLPTHAEDVYYRDTIGNISTSALREEEDGTLLLLRPRFPMFGGWHTTFYLGHNTPAKDFLFVDPEGRHVLRFDLPPYLRGAVTDDLTVKVVLPEGSTDVRVDHPFGDYGLEQSSSRRFTYLDSSFGGGRPVLILRMASVVDEHRQPVSVSYRVSGFGLGLEPLMLIASFLAFFATVIVVVRIRFAIAPREVPKAKSQWARRAATPLPPPPHTAA